MSEQKDDNGRIYVVRWHRSRKCLTADPETVWRWSEPSQATRMTRAEADAAAARMGGVVCIDGVPVDKVGTVPPKKPPVTRAPKASATDVIGGHVAAERWREALRLAVKLRGLGADKLTLERAMDGLTRPDFCRELKRDPQALVKAGIDVLRRRFGDKK